MKLLLCLVLCFVAVQATHLRSTVTYAAPYTTYIARVAPVPAPVVYPAPLPLTYTTGVVAPVPIVHGSVGFGIGGHLVGAAYAAPVVAARSVHTTVLKK